jgi:hypothetical protein
LPARASSMTNNPIASIELPPVSNCFRPIAHNSE